MQESSISHWYYLPQPPRPRQGDIIRDVTFYISEKPEEAYECPIFFHYGILMSQDCDLSRHFIDTHNPPAPPKATDDKILPTVLICPAYEAESFFLGTHLTGRQMEPQKSSSRRDSIKNNNDKRYHFLPKSTKYNVPELVIDFKHFYTLPAEMVFKGTDGRYIATVNELFRESLSQRFAHYLSRVGLPELDLEEIERADLKINDTETAT